MWAGIILSWEIAGYKLGDSVSFLAGTSLFKKDVKHKVFHKLFNIKTYSTFSLNDEDIKYYIDDINKNKIKIIYGYATALNKMAEYILDKKETKFPTLKGIVSSAEVLTEEHRRNIQEAFGVRVYNQYGCNEGGVSAFECEENHLHLINTKCKYEIDQDGNLLASDLINKGFFMLRYFTGDKLIMDENKQCSCGRGFPVIEKVIGRSYDIVVDNKNKILHAAFFNILFKQDPSIRQFQIQFDKKMISINLKVDEVYAKPERYFKYVDIIKQHLCFDEYNLKLNAPFMISQNAKHKYVVNTAA
jgi:phenylacetate-CoA ligase